MIPDLRQVFRMLVGPRLGQLIHIQGLAEASQAHSRTSVPLPPGASPGLYQQAQYSIQLHQSTSLSQASSTPRSSTSPCEFLELIALRVHAWPVALPLRPEAPPASGGSVNSSGLRPTRRIRPAAISLSTKRCASRREVTCWLIDRCW